MTGLETKKQIAVHLEQILEIKKRAEIAIKMQQDAISDLTNRCPHDANPFSFMYTYCKYCNYCMDY